MKNSHVLFIIFSSLFLCVACSKDEIKPPKDKFPPVVSAELSMLERVSLLDNYEIPKSKILDIVSKFELLALGESELKSISDTDYQIGEKYYYSEAQNALTTKPDGDKNEQLPIYKVQMSKKGKRGYALVSADARHARVIAFIPGIYVDSDEKADDSYINIGAREIEKSSLMSALQRIKAFNKIKDSLRQSAKRKLELKSSLRSSQTPDSDFEWLDKYPQYVVEKTTKKFPLIKLTWDQGAPYSCKLPQNCSSNPEGRYLAGCGAVAIASAIAHCEPKLNIYAYNMDWPNIKKTSKLKREETSKAVLDQVGMLMKWIGETAGSKYDCTGTSTDANAIESILPKVGMRCDGGREWDWNVISASLRDGKIVHVSAASDKGEHRWLMDAYTHINVGGSDAIYVHHNFGCGGDWDGYYEVESPLEFTTNGGQVYNKKFRIQANISNK